MEAHDFSRVRLHWLVEVDLLDDEETADAADLKSQLEVYKK